VDQGVDFGNVHTVYNEYTYATGLGMLWFDACVYTLVGMYLDKVLPKEFGIRRPCYFCLVPSFWRPSWTKRCPSGPTAGDRTQTTAARHHQFEAGHHQVESGTHIEDPGPELKRQVAAQKAMFTTKLRKTFPTPDGVKVAVECLNLTMFEGQITCLLGHNGAGKTTTISMLTGLVEPTEGNAVIRGRSIRDPHSLGIIRRSLGVCPQHNILFDALTVEEHLVFFGGLKGFWAQGRSGGDRGGAAPPFASLEEEVLRKVREVGLAEKRHVPSQSLSGGMKRKLSVAIALMGDSKLVFLDEPTSGMDPFSRRFTWDILRNSRGGRVMVLTTHFMDEADLLGDRIVIMAGGGVRCAGSSLFLKNRYGAGYSLVLVKDGTGCFDAGELQKLVRGIVPESSLLSDAGSEVSYQLPASSVSQFPALFSALDARLQRLHIVHYGMSVTTMEDVFLKVGRATVIGPFDHPDDNDNGSLCVASAKMATADDVDDMVPAALAEGGTARNCPDRDGLLPSQSHSLPHLAGNTETSPPSPLSPVPAPSVATPSSRNNAAAAAATAATARSKAPMPPPAVEWTKQSQGRALCVQHFRALLEKRYRCATRDYKSVFCNTLLPVLLLCVGLLILKYATFGAVQPEYDLATDAFADMNPLHASSPVPYNDGDAFRATMMSRVETAYLRLHTVPLGPNSEFDLDFSGQSVEVFNVEYPSNASYLVDAHGYNQSRLNIGQRVFNEVKRAEPASIYGGYIFEATDLNANTSSVPPGAFSGFPGPQLRYTIMANSSALHTAPAFAGVLHSLFYHELRRWQQQQPGHGAAAAEGCGGGGGGSITVTSWPVARTAREENLLQSIVAFAATVQITIAFSFVPAATIAFVVREREPTRNCKYQQVLSGVSIPVYWLSTFCWDLLVYLVTFACVIFLIWAFQVTVFVGDPSCDFNCLENPFAGPCDPREKKKKKGTEARGREERRPRE
jgi:ABC-type multidrug transport system ATPase subunit